MMWRRGWVQSWLICVGCAGFFSAHADVYVMRDANGVAHLTNVVPKKNSGYTLFQKSAWTKPKAWRDGFQLVPRLDVHTYDDEINYYARQYGVDPTLVRAVMHAESAFNPNAVSSAGAGGLMQLMPQTAARFGVADRFNPQQNIAGGVAYLAFLLDLFHGDRRLAVAAYNAGEGAVQKYDGVPPYDETQNYVVRVLGLQQKYQDKMSGGAAGTP
ncbi:lytic transglycosylase domain-containing protein [Halothiobacillus sp. DCM-1]|uniref:lytic transglycosylase domain-containing protein n=1 Tax=Halothiobacillus sp. DCM-1 TaxID=3112558 RepID=UPI00324B29CD